MFVAFSKCPNFTGTYSIVLQNSISFNQQRTFLHGFPILLSLWKSTENIKNLFKSLNTLNPKQEDGVISNYLVWTCCGQCISLLNTYVVVKQKNKQKKTKTKVIIMTSVAEKPKSTGQGSSPSRSPGPPSSPNSSNGHNKGPPQRSSSASTATSGQMPFKIFLCQLHMKLHIGNKCFFTISNLSTFLENKISSKSKLS